MTPFHRAFFRRCAPASLLALGSWIMSPASAQQVWVAKAWDSPLAAWRQSDLAMLGNLHRRSGDLNGVAIVVEGPQRQAWARRVSSGRYGFQTGTDLYAGGAWRTGLYLGQLEGDIRGLGGSVGRVDLRSQHLGLYGTWQGESGFYADAVLQASRHDHGLYTAESAGAGGKGRGLLASIELGHVSALGHGWKIEPQLQLIHQRLDLDPAALVGGTARQSLGSDWVVRAGVRVQGELSTAAGLFQPYGRVNLYRRGTELALGATLQLDSRWSVYGEWGRQMAAGGAQRSAAAAQGSLGLKAKW